MSNSPEVKAALKAAVEELKALPPGELRARVLKGVAEGRGKEFEPFAEVFMAEMKSLSEMKRVACTDPNRLVYEYASLKKKCEELEEENARLRKREMELQGAGQLLEAENAKLKECLFQMQNAAIDLKAKLAALEKEIAEAPVVTSTDGNQRHWWTGGRTAGCTHSARLVRSERIEGEK